MAVFVHKDIVQRCLSMIDTDGYPIPPQLAHQLNAKTDRIDQSLFVNFLRYYGEPNAARATGLREMGRAFIGPATCITVGGALHDLSMRYMRAHEGNAGRFYVQQHGADEWQVTAAMSYPYPFIEGMVITALEVEPGKRFHVSAGTVTRRFVSLMINVLPDNVDA